MYVVQASRLSGPDELWYWPGALAGTGQATACPTLFMVRLRKESCDQS